MLKKSNNVSISLIITIILVTSILSSVIVFAGMKIYNAKTEISFLNELKETVTAQISEMFGEKLDKKIDESLPKFTDKLNYQFDNIVVKNIEDKYGEDISKAVEPIINKKIASGLEDEIGKGIEKFIAKQQEDQVEAQRKQQEEQEGKVKNVKAPSADYDYFKGEKDAPITVIEFSDFECPFCKKVHPTLQQVLEEYDGEVNWVYRHLPLAFHLPNAEDQAEAAECVGELKGAEAFWEFVNTLYERTASNKGFEYEKIQPLAEEVGVNASDFAKCMDSDKQLAKVKADSDEATSLGISGTPAVIIRNNKTGDTKFLGGAYPFESFKEIIDSMK